jgi:hypothetical protein
MQAREIAALIAGFLFAPLAPALVFTGLSASLQILPLAFAVALAHAIAIGLPLFALIYIGGRISFLACIAGGFAAGAIPMGLFTWPLLPWSRSSTSVNGVDLIVNGIPTAAGWVSYAKGLMLFGGLGILGGLVFWIVLKLSGGILTPSDKSATAAEPQDARPPRMTTAFPAIVLAAMALLVSGAIASIPAITKDRTCHNMFRDGRTTIAPIASLEIPAGLDDVVKAIRVLEEFSVQYELSLRDTSRRMPNLSDGYHVSLCNDRGMNILMSHHASPGWSPQRGQRGIGISIYETKEGSGWEKVASDLVGTIESNWGGNIALHRSGDRNISGAENPKRTNSENR